AAAASSWHGTRTAATVAAARNGTGGVGVAFDAKVMPLRALGRCGGRASDVADAIVWAAGGAVPGVPTNRDPVEVINLSLSGAGTCGPTLQAAIDFANAAGTAVVVAAGNDGGDAQAAAPASCSGTIVVGALDAQRKLASYSNRGAGIDLVAPGGDATHLVASARLDGAGPGYRGTSAAAAHVAGVAALVQSVKARTPAELERLLKASAQWLDCSDCGAGLVDADKAVGAAMWPSLLISGPALVNEGTGGITQLTYTVSLSEPFFEPIGFRVVLKTGPDYLGNDTGATPGEDFVHGDWGPQTFAPGETSRQFVVGIVGDARTEFSEKFLIEAQSTSNNVTYTYAAVEVGIDDDNDVDTLVNGQAVPLSGYAYVPGELRYFRIDVPVGSPRLRVSTAGGSAYVRQGSLPTPADLSCPKLLFSETRRCVISNPAPGPWYIAAAGGYGDTLLAEVEPYGLIVGDARLSEHDAGSRVMTFTVAMQAALTTPVTFDLATANGSATAGADYVAASATGLTLPAGMVSRTFSVDINGDAVDESDETFTVNLTNAVGSPVVDAQGVGTIVDDDGTGGLTIADAGVDEGGALVFVASLAAPQATPVAFEVLVSDGTATGGPPPIYENQITGDYVQRPVATGYIPAGQLATTLVVTTQEDTDLEDDETVLLDIGAVYGATASDRHAVGTIRNDDYRQVNIGNATIYEAIDGYQTATVTARLSHVSTGDVSFKLAAIAVTANPVVDIEPLTAATLTIPAGQSETTFTVTALNDAVVESREQFQVAAVEVVGAITGIPGNVTIVSDEMPLISVADATVTEGDSGTRLMSFTVQLSQAVASPVRYTFSAPGNVEPKAAAEVGNDYGGRWTDVGVIPAGQTSHVETVVIYGDTLREGDETFSVFISEGLIEEAVVGRGDALGTIVDDDATPVLTVDDLSVVEGDAGTKVLTFTARLSGPNPDMPAMFEFATRNGTAIAGSDFNARASTTAYIAAGQLATTINVVVSGDTAIEPTETFYLDVVPVSGVNIVDREATGYIINNDGPLIYINDVAVGEGASGTKLMTFTVSLSQAAAGPVSYSVSTTGGDATAGNDYVALNLTNQVIPQGQLSKTHSVTINGDATIEPTEAFFVNVRQPTGASVWDGQGIGYILNDDGPTLSVPDASVAEGASGTKVMSVTVQLSQVAAVPVTFSIATANVSAAAGSDYTPFNLTNQTIPAGQTTKVFPVPINGDTTVEQNESFTVTLSNPTGASLFDRQALGTIYNDDGPTLSIND
ncbi:MAG: Calx-beta domain-containing protein, partial [Arenimonas sp.]